MKAQLSWDGRTDGRTGEHNFENYLKRRTTSLESKIQEPGGINSGGETQMKLNVEQKMVQCKES